ncbi:MAG: hypothetical protein E6344_07115 [Clostridium sp.]|nr:hypothetical protein [Clostridium sp.]MDU7083446.1 hypothetical protein [Clostridium sp.]
MISIFLLGCIILFVYFLGKLGNVNFNKKVLKINKSLNKINNVFGVVGIFISLISILVALIAIYISIKEPILDISFFTAQYREWSKEHETRLYLSQDKDNHIDFVGTMPHTWKIKLDNRGNKVAEKIKVEISFSELQFINQPDDYNLKNHNYGLGGFATIEWKYENLNPGEEMYLPDIPFDKAIIIDFGRDGVRLESIIMNIDIYVNDIKNSTQKYIIDITDNYFVEKDCYFDGRESNDEYKIYKIINSVFNSENLKSIRYNNFLEYDFNSLESAYNIEVYKEMYNEYVYMYNYYLKKISVLNDVVRKNSYKNALLCGRIKYRCESLMKEDVENRYSISDIEEMIRNDIEINLLR